MSLKKLIIAALVLLVLFFVGLNAGLIGDQAMGWVKDHPKDPHAPDVLFRAGRWCDLMGANEKAIDLYWMLYEDYPERADLCAPALYYCAAIRANSSYVSGIRKQANSYLDILVGQYSSQEEWRTKAKQLYDEVNYVHSQ